MEIAVSSQDVSMLNMRMWITLHESVNICHFMLICCLYMSLTQENLLNLEARASGIVKKYGIELLKVWQDIKEVSLKDAREPVTAFDVATEESLRKELSILLPEAGFLVEEGEDDVKEEYNWSIDPIDQTKNFIGQLPLFYIQLALVYKGESVLGIVYNPVSDQLICASSGNGARVNGKLVTGSEKRSLAEALIDLDLGGNDEHTDLKLQMFNKLMRAAYRVRVSGGSFYPYLATGALDGYVLINQSIKITEKYPRIILARELDMKYERVELKEGAVEIAAKPAVFEEIKGALNS